MHVLHPMHPRMRRPAAAFTGSSGSAMSARVIPTASTVPSPIRRSARSGSTMREFAINGGPSRKPSRCLATAFSSIGGGGTIPTEPRYVEDSPSATET